MREVDQLHISLIERVSRWALVVLVSAGGGLLVFSPKAAAGVAIGGGLSLGLLALHRALASRWLLSGRGRARRVAFWALWLLKWPCLCLLLYLALSRGWVAAGWLCAGAGLVPAVATGLALRAVLLDLGRGQQPIGVKP
jgi:hypothetical protein